MSRNLRQKYPASAPVKARAIRRRTSRNATPDLDDSSGYSAIEDVSDSDDADEDAVDAAEAEHFQTQAERSRSARSSRPLTPELNLQTDEDDGGVADDDDDDDDDDDEADDDDGEQASSADSASEDGFGGDTEDNEDASVAGDDNDNAVEDGTVPPSQAMLGRSVLRSNSSTDREGPATPANQRHVRFANVPSSDSESTDTEEYQDFYEDIFVPQDHLAKRFRRRIEREPDATCPLDYFEEVDSGPDPCMTPGESDWEESFFGPWIVNASPTPRGGQDCNPTSRSIAAPSPPAEESGDDYDSDATEDDMPVRVCIATMKPATRPLSESASDSETPAVLDGERPLDNSSGKNRPVVVMNYATRKIMVFMSQDANQLDLSPEALREQLPTLDSDTARICLDILDSQPFLDGVSDEALFQDVLQHAFSDSDPEDDLDISLFIHCDEDASGSDSDSSALQTEDDNSSSTETPGTPTQHFKAGMGHSSESDSVNDNVAEPAQAHTSSKRKSATEQFTSHKRQRSISEVGNMHI